MRKLGFVLLRLKRGKKQALDRKHCKGGKNAQYLPQANLDGMLAIPYYDPTGNFAILIN